MTDSLDPEGIVGSLLHYALVLFFVCGAFIILLYLWQKGRLDMDEEPKFQMLRDSETIEMQDIKENYDRK